MKVFSTLQRMSEVLLRQNVLIREKRERSITIEIGKKEKKIRLLESYMAECRIVLVIKGK